MIVLAVAALLASAATATYLFSGRLLSRSSAVAEGSALEAGMEGDLVALSVIVGDRVYFMGPGIVNQSDGPVSIRSLRPYHRPASIRFMGVRSYRVEDFDGGTPMGWYSSARGVDAAFDPDKRPSQSVIGRTIQPEVSLVDPQREFILLEFRVTSPGAWTIPCLEVEYEQRGQRYSQAIGGMYELRVYESASEKKDAEDEPRGMPTKIPCPYQTSDDSR
jgi:hypothetical protein